ncbi:sirohydrochlorin chelatase, partial [Streptomyces sp. S6]
EVLGPAPEVARLLLRRYDEARTPTRPEPLAVLTAGVTSVH